MAFKLAIVLAACLAMAGQAWAGPPASAKPVPIIDVVAKTPADSINIFPAPQGKSPDLRLDPGLVQSFNPARKAEDGQPPLGVKAGPLSAQFQTSSDTALDRRLEGLRQPGAYQYDPRLDDPEQQGGFLALRWKASNSSEILLGGGYTRSYSSAPATAQGSSAVVRSGSGAATNRSGESGSLTSDANGRWGAFLAVPYQLGKNLGVRPEVSYYQGDSPDSSRDATNEWVMGLRFTFGF